MFLLSFLPDFQLSLTQRWWTNTGSIFYRNNISVWAKIYQLFNHCKWDEGFSMQRKPTDRHAVQDREKKNWQRYSAIYHPIKKNLIKNWNERLKNSHKPSKWFRITFSESFFFRFGAGEVVSFLRDMVKKVHRKTERKQKATEDSTKTIPSH